MTSALQRLVDSYDNVVQAILADPRVAADRNHQLVADYLALFPEGSAFASGTLDFWASEGAASRSVPPHDPIKRLNDRHQDALLAIARALTPHTDAVAAIALAIDDFGVSLDVKTADGGHRLRYVAFAAPARAGRRRLAFRDLAREAADRLSVRSTGVAR